MNTSVSCVACVKGLIDPPQCGSLAGLSVADACTTLTHEIRTLQMDKRKVSTLFLDIKGGFDNLNSSTLGSMMSARGINPYLVSWTQSFLSGRSCRLLFQGWPKTFSLVSVGTPQGSSVCPLLFVIYVSRLHSEIPFGLTLSYVDDLALTVSLASYRRNIQLLQGHYTRIKAKGIHLGVGFSIPKTELIHWRTNRDRHPPSGTPIHLDVELFRPKEEIRWLGYWFTPSLSTTPHFTKRLAKAQAAFVAIKSLSPPGMGLPPFLCDRLASSLLFPILGSWGEVFTPTVHMLRKLSAFTHKTQTWCTNCFLCTATNILAIKACLPPLDWLFSYKRRLAGLRILCSPSQLNTSTARLPPSVETRSQHRHASDNRSLLRGNAGHRNPLPWRCPRTPTKNRAYLPLDAITHSLLFLLGSDGLAQLPVTC